MGLSLPNPAPDVDLEAPGLMQPPPKPTAPHGEFLTDFKKGGGSQFVCMYFLLQGCSLERREMGLDIVIWLKSSPKDGYVA